MRNRLFGFGYYEGYRNDSGITNNVVVLSEAQRRGDFSAVATPIRDPLTGLPFPGNIIPGRPDQPAGHAAAERLRAAPELARQPLHRVARRWSTTATSSACGSTTSSVPTDHPRPLHAERHRSHHAARHCRRGPAGDGDASGLHGVAQLRDQLERDQPGPLLDQPDHRQPGGDLAGWRRAAMASTSTTPTRPPPGCRRSWCRASSAAAPRPSAIAQQPFVDRVNHVWQAADDTTWIKGRHSMKFGVDIRREAMKIAFINRPNGDLTFNGVTLRQRGVGLPARLSPPRCGRPRPRRSRTATAGCMPATSRTSSASRRG